MPSPKLEILMIAAGRDGEDKAEVEQVHRFRSLLNFNTDGRMIELIALALIAGAISGCFASREQVSLEVK